MASIGWGTPSNDELLKLRKEAPITKNPTQSKDFDPVDFYNWLRDEGKKKFMESVSDEALMASIEMDKRKAEFMNSVSDDALMASIRNDMPNEESQPPMGAFEYLRKSAESKGVEFIGPEWKKNLDATLIALTPFSGKVLRMGSGVPEDLVKTAKGDFDINDRLIREDYHQEFIPYYAGVMSIEDVKKSIQEKAKLQALNHGSKERAIAQEISERGTTTMGTVFGKGAEIVGQAGEMLVPGGLATKFAVGAGTEAAARYAEHANAKIGYDENGNPVILDGDSAGKAAKEALIGGGVQSGIELLGGKVLGKVWGATGGKLVGKAAGTALGQKVAENSIVKGVGKITNWLKAPLEMTGWSGMPGEIGEEFMQGATDAYFGLDTTDAEERGTTAGGRFKEFAGDFFKGENLADLAGSMLLMQAVGGGSAYLQKRHTNKQLNKIITEKIGGVSENVLNKLSPEEKAKIIEAHYKGLSAEETADIINKGAGALDKFMIEKQTEATKSADGRAMLAEKNPEAADAIRAARREGKDVSRKMIRDLGLSEKVLGDVESRNKFGDALLEDRRKLAAKNAAKMDGQHEMALRQEIGGVTQDTSEAQIIYDRIVMKLKDASVLDDPYQREQLVMQAAEAVYAEDQARRVGGARQKARMAEKTDHEARVAEAEARAAEQAQRAEKDARERTNAEMLSREVDIDDGSAVAKEMLLDKNKRSQVRSTANDKDERFSTSTQSVSNTNVEVKGVLNEKNRSRASYTSKGETKDSTASMPNIVSNLSSRINADAASTPTKPKTVREGKAFVNSNIGKRYTDGKKTYEITGLTKDGEVSVKVTDKIGKSSENTIALSGALTRIFGTKKTSAVWSEVKTPEAEQKTPNRTKTTAKTPKTEQKVPKAEVADKKTARVDEKAEVKRNESGSKAEVAGKKPAKPLKADAEPKTAPNSEPKAEAKAEVKEPKSETAPSITPAEAMKKLGSLGAADVDTLTKAMHREERLGHTERANMIRVLRDYKRGVGTNSNPQSDETSGGKYRASVEAAKPLDDPAFVAWAKKRGVAPTTQKRNEYDKAMADTLKNRLSRWIKGVTVKTVNFIAPEEGGDVRAAKKYSRAGTVAQRVKKNERGVFRQELTTILANYAHNNNGEYPKSCGLFTSDAYYIFDIIDGTPVNIHRMSLNERNREKIKAFDKKYKREIYRGARSAAGWVDWIETEHVGVLSGDNGVVGNKGADGSLLDGSGSKEGRGLSFERVGAEKNLGGEEDSGSSSEAKNQTVYLHDGERIVGSYNRATGEVKLAKGASVETVLHELGWHAARHWAEVNADSDPKAKALLEQMKKYAESAPKEIKDAVRDVYGDLDADTLLDEIGAHRFVKDQSGKIAEALATKEGAAWYQKVWNKVVDFFKNFLTKIGYNRVDLDGVENMSPEVFGDFLADVMMSGKQLGERTAFSMEAPKGLVAKWTNNLSDYKAPIAELEKRVMTSSNKIYYLARTLEGQAQRGKNRAERAIKRVEKILGEDISPELLAQYMQLKAYEERNAKIERRNGKADASGMTPEDARAIEKTIEDSGVDEAIFEEAAQILWDLQKEGLQARVDAGLLDQETANKWMTDEPHHIPWKDAVDPDSGEYVGRKVGASEFDTAEGRKTAASGDPITWMFQEYQDAMTRAAQNRLRSAIANLTRLEGDVGTIYDGIQTDSKGKRSFIKYPKDGGKAKVLSIPEGVKIESTVKNDGGMKNVLTFKEGGETKYLVLNGTLGEAVAGAVTGRTLARPIPYLGAWNRFNSATATTFSWAFAAKNYKRDTIDVRNNFIADFGWKKGNMLVASAEKFAWTHIKELSRYAATGELSLDKKGNPTTEFAKLVLEYEDAGGLMSGNAVQSYDHIEKQIKADFRFGKNRVRSLAKGAADLYTAVPKISELLTRMGAFAALRKDGMSAKDAVMWARESTFDFDKKGAFAPVLNSLWLFSNANIQAAHRQLRGLIKSKNGWKVAADMAVVGFVMHIVNEMLNSGTDDDDEKEGLGIDKDISEYDRQHYIFLRFGQKMYRTPVNLGPYGFARYIGDVTARMMTGDISVGEAAKNLGVSAAEISATFSGVPINMGAVLQTATPSPFFGQEIVQGLSGKNFAGFDVYKNKYPNNKTPDSHYGKRTTAPAYKWVSEKLNELTGGNEAKPGGVDIRPETVELFVQALGKSVLRDITDLSRIRKAFTVDDKDIDGNESRYWDAKAVYDQDEHELNHRSDLKGEARRAYLKEHPWLYSAGKPGVTRIDNIVKRIEKLRDIEESDRATDERKAEAKAMRRKLQARVIEIMKGK